MNCSRIFYCYWRLKCFLFQTFAKRRKIKRSSSGILVIAPHPDDETFGCGELIASSIAEEREVNVVVVSNGSKSHEGCCNISETELVNQRYADCLNALKLLGVSSEHVFFLNYPDSRLQEYENEIREEILSMFGKRQVELFVPHPSEVWPDHLTIARLGSSLAELNGWKCFYYFIWVYVYGMSLKNIFSVFQNRFFYVNNKDAWGKKKNAIYVYQKSFAACGKPYAGVLPKNLWSIVFAHTEMFEQF